MTTPPGPGGPQDPQPYPPPPPPGQGQSPTWSYPGSAEPTGTAGYSYPGAPAGPPESNGLAIGSLITGLVAALGGCFCLGAPLGPVAIVLGFLGLKNSTRSGGRVGGRGMAISGIVLGIVATLMLLAWIGLFAYLGTLDPAELNRWLERQGVETTTT